MNDQVRAFLEELADRKCLCQACDDCRANGPAASCDCIQLCDGCRAYGLLHGGG